MGYRGRHRSPCRLVVNAARIAVGGLALAEITGGLSAIPAHAEPVTTSVVVPAAYSTAQPVMSRHRHERKHHPAHHAKKAPARAAVQAAAPAVHVEPVAVVQQATFETADLDQQQLFDHYIVQPGDTLTHIAAAYGVDWASLWSFNTDQVAHPDSIWPGLQLRLPA